MVKPVLARRVIGRTTCLIAATVLMVACVPDTGSGGSTSTTSPNSTTTSTSSTTTTSTSTSTTTTSTTTSTTSTTTSTTTTTAPPTTTTTSTTTTTTVPAPTSVTKYTALVTACQGTALGQTSGSDNNTGITTVAPSYVSPGSNFVLTITPDPMVIPTTGGGQSIQYLSQVKIRIPVPTGTSFVSATLSGASNVGTGTPTVAQSGGVITLTVPGNLTAGTTATLPKITLTLKATGGVGTQINTILAGTSYADPGITFNVKIDLFGLTVATNCFVNPSPVFSTTPIQ